MVDMLTPWDTDDYLRRAAGSPPGRQAGLEPGGQVRRLPRIIATRHSSWRPTLGIERDLAAHALRLSAQVLGVDRSDCRPRGMRSTTVTPCALRLMPS
jgi:hypothetical protein